MTRTQARSRPLSILVLATCTAWMLTGCGGGSAASSGGKDPGPAVASVKKPTTTAAPAAAGNSNQDSRPLERPDTSAKEQTRMYNAYWKCLIEHGIPDLPPGTGEIQEPGEPRKIDPTITQAKPADDGRAAYTPARNACANKQPEDYKDRFRRQHAHEYEDKAREELKCIRAKGIKIEDVKGDDDPLHFSYVDDASIARGMGVTADCEKEVFGSIK